MTNRIRRAIFHAMSACYTEGTRREIYVRKSFVHSGSPMLIGVIREETVRGAIAAIRNCEYHGATALDLHLSCLKEEARTVESLKQIIDASRLPIMALSYNQAYDNKPIDMPEEPRLELLLRAVEAGVSAVDMQGYSYDLPSKTAFREEFKHLGYSFIRDNPKEVVVDEAVIAKQKAFIEKVHAGGAEVVISTHPWVPMDCEQVTDLMMFLSQRGADMLKIVAPCENDDQLAECFKTMLKIKKIAPIPTHFHCCGKAGSLSRILNPILGGHMIFCSDGYSVSSNFEQLDLQTSVRIVNDMKKLMY